MGSDAALAKLVQVEKTADRVPGKQFAEQVSGFRFGRTRLLSKLPREKINELIIEHREHGKRLAWSFLTSWRVRMHQDEVMSVVGMALCEAANRFDAEKGVAFKTFFFYHLRGLLLKEIARAIHEQRVLQYVPHTVVSECANTEHVVFAKDIFSLIENNNPERLMQKRQLSRTCWEACMQLDPLEREVLVRFFVYDEPLIQIADELRYCRCHISRVKSRALLRLEKILKRSDIDQALGFELKALKEAFERSAVKSSKQTRRKSYTGGRGRRKQRQAEQKAAAGAKNARAAA
ncbi:MAG TPA: sigma-70 family RNA polymerase sigma factor [Oligoflexia bacterium]|nr:sigma-70 family RNA polymerase sigma factor [Oligoflexia bacterium]